MANSDKNIEQVFNNEFQNFEHDVSDKVWNNLDKTLFGNTVIDYSMSISKSFLISLIPFSILISSTFLINDNVEGNTNIKSELISNELKKSNLLTAIQNEESLNNNIKTVLEEDNDYPLDSEIIMIEENRGEDVEQIIVENKNSDKKKNSVPVKKKLPELSDKPYLNHNYFKSKSSEVYSNFCISKLKSGVLLVRLKTREYGIEALIKSGQKKKAEKLEQEVFDDNYKVVEAFQNEFNFSKVYFFYSSESDKIASKNFENVFLNPNTLKIDNSISLNPSEKFYLFLDIGALKIPDNENITHSSSALSRALVLKDRDFEQLYRPFPFYVSANSKKNIYGQVSKLNERLHVYYKDNGGKY